MTKPPNVSLQKNLTKTLQLTHALKFPLLFRLAIPKIPLLNLINSYETRTEEKDHQKARWT